MKRVIFSFLVVTLFCQLSFAGGPETSMSPIMNKAKEMLNLLENDYNMEIVRMEFDILRSTKTTQRTLSAGWTYMIIAFGDYRFRDIDIKVYRMYNGEWQLVEKDNDSQSVAGVSIKPQSQGEYLIEITAYSFESGYDVGHYGLIIAHE